MNLSFAGCGFLGIYHVGVAVCFKKYAPHLLLEKISGASAGAIAACCLLCDLPLGLYTSDLLKLSKEARRKTLGPFSPTFNLQAILLESLQKYLPEDAHIRVNGKLHISLTRVYDGRNVIVSQFNSREDLFQALLATSFVPIFSGILPPRFHGIRYMDGGFSDNLPTLDENTITISPFCGESDICPRDFSSQLFHVNFANTSIELSRDNIYRFARILFPPNPEILSKMCQQGFDDALRFLHRNNLINCTRCVAIQSPFVVSETLDDSTEYDPECIECKIHRQEALVANLPETVMSILQDAIDSANKGIVNWLFKHKSIKLLSVLSLPYTLPVDVMCATINKVISTAPKLSINIIELIRNILKQVNLLLPTINIQFISITDLIRFQVALAKYKKSYSEDDTDGCIKPWRRDAHTDNGDNFENILHVTTDYDALMAYYYMNQNKNTAGINDLFKIKSNDYNVDLNFVDNSNVNIEFSDDSWDEPDWIAQHTLADVTEIKNNTMSMKEIHIKEDDQGSLELSDHSIEDSTIFSDPESEWVIDKTDKVKEVIENTNSTPTSLASDCRPEVDQPSL
ncbi:1-acylglycerol-3-phosphate O-acyltransferase Pnpla3 [Microplitis demolitor]|uniref:1-acylglycerol-3-phosphate O-acyltransferase Pnpla3 n=1 Tax=Microplitis demolitor TaxID=69319 RepID=UPI00043FFE95|nr:1-acylglycerol-3-phosphate O-acyltransferase Pnpla3 [Microplitis demolitor]